MDRSELDEYAKKIREVKNLINVEWGNKAHTDAIDDQLGITAFDQVMDQVLILINCYQKIELNDRQKIPEMVAQQAVDAYLESVKAACGFLEKIASALVEQSKELIRQSKPVSTQLIDLNHRVNECKEKIEDARLLWEDNNPQGLDTLKSTIRQMYNFIDDIKLVLPNVAHEEERAKRQESHSRWRLAAMWIAIGVAILMGILNLIASLNPE